MPIDRLFLDKLILKFVDLECRNYGNVKFYSKGLGVYLFDFESFEAKQLVSDKGGVLNNSYRWGTPTATCPKQFSWSEAFHIPISKVFELWGLDSNQFDDLYQQGSDGGICSSNVKASKVTGWGPSGKLRPPKRSF
ncbi:hypothetical protein D5086_014360 [Populus alba]|uniref:Uncharacterized protein n=1 Tax=Populus alba TaxID=43335 RepID=A0ACC4BYT6_POPAL